MRSNLCLILLSLNRESKLRQIILKVAHLLQMLTIILCRLRRRRGRQHVHKRLLIWLRLKARQVIYFMKLRGDLISRTFIREYLSLIL